MLRGAANLPPFDFLRLKIAQEDTPSVSPCNPRSRLAPAFARRLRGKESSSSSLHSVPFSACGATFRKGRFSVPISRQPPFV